MQTIPFVLFNEVQFDGFSVTTTVLATTCKNKCITAFDSSWQNQTVELVKQQQDSQP